MSRVVSLDLRGVKCPVSTMRLKKTLKTLASGDTIRVTSDDPESEVDFPAVFIRAGVDDMSREDVDKGGRVFVGVMR